MKALITGASSGIGKDIAIYLSEIGYDIIVVARRRERLEKLKSTLKGNVHIYEADLSDEKQCFKLFDDIKAQDIDLVINNAGMGIFGEFTETDLNKELNMIDINIKALHILTKLFLKEFEKKNSGHILNVSSSAGFMMGPLFSSYYASKSYVLRLSQAIYRELKEKKSKVKISVLCPGPVKTEFDSNAGVKNSLSGLNSMKVAKYAVNKALKGKFMIVPGLVMKLSVTFSKFLPQNLLSKITYNCQKKKQKSPNK